MTGITCRDLTYCYGRTPALKNVNLSLETGAIVGLLGPNGSGKTTLIKLANRLLLPSDGEILINGEKPGPKTKAVVSYLPDRECLPDGMNIKGLLSFYQRFFADFRRDKAEAMLETLHIDPRQTMKKLSKGNREKVQLALCMSRDANIYILDEPIAGVDPAARDEILHTILSNYAENALVLLSTHLIADVEKILDEVVFIRNGEILLHRQADDLREETGMSIDAYFREVFRC